jgi:hypothetical protein
MAQESAGVVSGRDGAGGSMVRPATSSRATLREGAKRAPSGGLGNVLRTYFVQQCFNLSDPGVEETLWGAGDSLGLDLGIAPSPDETTIGRFRHLLEKHDLGSLLASANSSSTHYQKALSPVFGLLEPVPYCISRSRTSSQVRAIPCSRANLGRHPSPCSFDTSISF